jgi:uncharacterized membrane protein
MAITRSKKLDVRNLTYLAVFTAIVFVLQLLSFFTRGPVFSLTFVLVPIVIAVAICGTKAGPWLGFVFGVAVLVTGDANAFLAIDPVATVAVVLIKGTLAGLAAALVYKLLANKNKYLAVCLAAITAPIVNSGVFFLGSLLFFKDALSAWAPESQNVVVYILTVLIGFNFLIEVGVNLILVPTIHRIIEIASKKKR